VGGSKAGGLPHPSLSSFPPLPLSIPLSFQTNQWEGRSDPVRGKFPGFPPTNTTLVVVAAATVVDYYDYDNRYYDYADYTTIKTTTTTVYVTICYSCF